MSVFALSTFPAHELSVYETWVGSSGYVTAPTKGAPMFTAVPVLASSAFTPKASSTNSVTYWHGSMPTVYDAFWIPHVGHRQGADPCLAEFPIAG